ncbi:hypothetical protein AB1N83_008692 [Pleurotus pulmonarius]
MLQLSWHLVKALFKLLGHRALIVVDHLYGPPAGYTFYCFPRKQPRCSRRMAPADHDCNSGPHCTPTNIRPSPLVKFGTAIMTVPGSMLTERVITTTGCKPHDTMQHDAGDDH